jgi:hypothetical protein
MSRSRAATELPLQVLHERNLELQRRLEKLNELSRNLEENVQRMQTLYEGFLTTQENQCIDMVQFDEEIKTLSLTFFPQIPSKQVTPRKRDENSNYIMQMMMGLQQLDPDHCRDRLLKDDPMLKKVRFDVELLRRFITKYSSFL